ncbi:hypothetical protein MKX01_019526 [Papaver californicum]|nr:hypothetical protein MKX01_019526 [Papaver californicum]
MELQISFSGVVFPALLTCYIGQAEYLSKFPADVHDTFYKSIPNPIYWPTFTIAVAATIIASQAMISAAFAIITQALSLGAFPRVKVVHTSAKYEGQKRYMLELKNKVSGEFGRDLVKNPNVNRIPGIDLLSSELVQGIPPIFHTFFYLFDFFLIFDHCTQHNIPSIHSVLVFVSIKQIPVSKVAAEKRFIFRQVEQKDYRMFRCVARYGYNGVVSKSEDFEQGLVKNMKEFVRYESCLLPNEEKKKYKQVEFIPRLLQEADKEIEFVQKAMEKGVVYLLGETEVVAEENSSKLKQVVVNYLYHFLRKNLRENDKILSIPHRKLLRVGMTYEI